MENLEPVARPEHPSTNSPSQASPNKRTTRIRRTPEEARAVILDAAEKRLERLGLEGLNVVGVADEAGLSHASVIHHFGNTAGMRQALDTRMVEALLSDLVNALKSDTEPQKILAAVFHAMAGAGHAKLLAWRALNEGESDLPDPAVQRLFKELIRRTGERFNESDPDRLRNCLLLIASAAIGLGVSGSALPVLLGVDKIDNNAFADWLSDLLLTEE